MLAQCKLHVRIKTKLRHISKKGEFPPPRLTNFADLGFPAKMTHRGQVKVTVFVYQGNLPLSGGATLVQTDLHHLQLHMINDTHKHRGERT